MAEKSLAEIIQGRRSIRDFDGESVDIETVKEIIGTASHAASNNNRQEWKFYILTDRAEIENIARQVELKLSECKTGSGVLDEMMTGYGGNFILFKNAPVVIACCCLKPAKFNYKLFNTDDENSHLTGELIGVSLVMQNIMLLAESMNLGTLIMTAPLIAAREIKEIVKIPDRYYIAAFICMGHYVRKPDAPSHKSLNEIIVI